MEAVVELRYEDPRDSQTQQVEMYEATVTRPCACGRSTPPARGTVGQPVVCRLPISSESIHRSGAGAS